LQVGCRDHERQLRIKRAQQQWLHTTGNEIVKTLYKVFFFFAGDQYQDIPQCAFKQAPTTREKRPQRQLDIFLTLHETQGIAPRFERLFDELVYQLRDDALLNLLVEVFLRVEQGKRPQVGAHFHRFEVGFFFLPRGFLGSLFEILQEKVALRHELGKLVAHLANQRSLQHA
jgi:hypothetical protein